MRTIAELLDRYSGSDWSSNIRDEVSKHCSAHYDEGQAVWTSPCEESAPLPGVAISRFD